ncbi:MAG: hypothetical protein IKU97_02215, partial [Tidjanibacter sp.]|nr:hypothetical protein [Tidjanibacter sp.]
MLPIVWENRENKRVRGFLCQRQNDAFPILLLSFEPYHPPKKQKKRRISRPAKKAAPQFANANEEAAFKRNEEITSYFAFFARILLSSA